MNFLLKKSMVIGNNSLLNFGRRTEEHHIDTSEMDLSRLKEGQNGIYFTVLLDFINALFIDIFFFKCKNSISMTHGLSFHNFFF